MRSESKSELLRPIESTSLTNVQARSATSKASLEPKKDAASVRQILLGAGQKIVDAHHRVAFSQQPVAHVGADKTGGPGYNNSQYVRISTRSSL